MPEAGVPIWSSEEWSINGDELGAGCLARTLNWNYVQGRYTSTVMWSLIAAWPKFMLFFGTGLLTAGEPWSGHFNQTAPAFVTPARSSHTASASTAVASAGEETARLARPLASRRPARSRARPPPAHVWLAAQRNGPCNERVLARASGKFVINR